MRFYTVYATAQAPEELLAAYPRHAVYLEGGISLFIKSIEDLTGEPPASVIDIAVMGFNEYGIEGEEGLTPEELTTMVMGYVARVQNGTAEPTEVRFSISQGRYLYKTIFKPTNNE